MPPFSSYKFSNLLGSVYKQGNVIFTADGNTLISPVGNRVSVYDLVHNKSRTLNIQTRKNINRIALSPDDRMLIVVDDDGRSLFVNFRRGVVVHHLNFKKSVRDIQFSPDGKYFGVTHGPQIHVYATPSLLQREFTPVALHRVYTGHFDDVLSITFSQDSQCFVTTSKDMTCKIYTLHPLAGYRPKTLSGHRDMVLAAYISADASRIYTVSRDGACFVWAGKTVEGEESDSDSDDEPRTRAIAAPATASIPNTRWGLLKRNYFLQQSKLTTCTFHAGLVVAGFANGVFGLWDVSHDAFNNVHSLSISHEKITSVAINRTGEWLAFGAAKLGQLLVWEWQSESYVLKQQGHFYNMTAVDYSADGQFLASGGQDGKLKIWDSSSGFCTITFENHVAAVTGVAFAKQGQIVCSCSHDGTVRAYDLARYRNFRTFTTPSPVQFECIAVDPSGEIVCAGGAPSADASSFDIYVWATATGKLIDVLSGHEGPVSTLQFSPLGDKLVSGSWDRSIRIWDIFGRTNNTEAVDTKADVTALTIRSDGKEACVATLDGQLTFYDLERGQETSIINGRGDIAGGRKAGDRTTAQNNAGNKHFTTLHYTPDGTCVLAGGTSKYVCVYHVAEGVLLKRYTLSKNLSYDGIEEMLDSRRLGAGGPLSEIDDDSDEDELDTRERQTGYLPGAQFVSTAGSKDLSLRKNQRVELMSHSVKFAPSGRDWAAATSDGLLIYSLDNADVLFDPFELDVDITPENILLKLDEQEYLTALVMALKLNEKGLLATVYETVPHAQISVLCRTLPPFYLLPLMTFIAQQSTPHVEFHLLWIKYLFASHGQYLKAHHTSFTPVFRSLTKALTSYQSSIANLTDQNTFTLDFLSDQMQRHKEKMLVE